MGRSFGEKGKILLLDNYSSESQKLAESFRQADSQIPVIVIEENDFLPENVLSIYDLIIDNYKNGKVKRTGRPKYFNFQALGQIHRL